MIHDLDLILREIAGHPVRYAAETLVLGALIHYLLLMLRGTRAMHVLRGLALLLAVFLLARLLRFHTLLYILNLLFPALVVALVIVFQQEIRRGLAVIGQRSILGGFFRPGGLTLVDEIVKTAHTLSQRRIGALIVIEQDANLKQFIESATSVDSVVDSKLLATIFTPYTPLHDGAVIISGGRIAAASALLPLSEKPDLDAELGTRHRAAIGLTEETDAIVIVVSEENGTVSMALHGELERNFDPETLRKTLNRLLGYEKELKAGIAKDVAVS